MADDIAVLAGTGKSGRRVAAALRVAGHGVRVAGRRGPVRFDWNEPTTWPAVVDGAEAVYVVVPDDDPHPVVPFLDGAVAAGVRRFVMLSGRALEHFGPRPGAAGLLAGEQAIAATGRGTILRVSNFDQNFTEGPYASAVRSGRLALPADQVADSFVDLVDVAAVAARVLTETGHEGRTYELTGPEALTFEHAVALLAAATDRDIRYEALDPDTYATELRAGGLDEFGIAQLNAMFAMMSEGHTAGVGDDLARILGRPARSFADWAIEQAGHGAG